MEFYKKMTNIIAKFMFIIYKVIGGWYLKPLLKYELKHPSFKEINERAVEFSFAFRWLSKICPSNVLDIGAGTTSWPHVLANCGFRVIATDKIFGYWKKGFFNRHYPIISDDITKSKLKGQFDFITCISVLEHIPDYNSAVKEMFRLLKKNGYLLLTFPYNEKKFIDNVYKLPGAGYGQDSLCICHVFSRNELEQFLKENNGKIVDQAYYEIFDGEFWTFGKRIYPPREVKKEDKCHLSCVLIQKKS